MLTPEELEQYQQEAEAEAAASLAERGKRMRRAAVSILAMAATLTGVSTGGGGTVEDELESPVLTWDGETLDLLPDVGISYEAEIGDIITLRRSTTSNFAAYEDASDTVESLVQALDFDFGGDWDSGVWYIKTFYTRDSEDSPDSNTVTVTIESDFLDARFSDDRLIIRDSVTGANAYDGTPQGKLTVTVDADGTFINASGVITQATANTLRIDHDPSTLVCKGLLVEPAATNLLLNSVIAGTSLATQAVSVTAVAHTLSFYGTGTITLSGASTAGPLVGSGAYPTRSTLTFTPSAATLTLTVSGTVQFAQLEVGSNPTSFIPTAGAAVARAADVVLISSGFPTNATNWGVIVEAIPGALTQTADANVRIAYALSNGTANEAHYFQRGSGSANTAPALIDGGASQLSGLTNAVVYGTAFKHAMRVKLNDIAVSFNGGTVGTDASATVPTIDRIYFGCNWVGTNQFWFGHIKRLVFLPRNVTNTELVSLST